MGRDVHVAWVAGRRGLQEQGADVGVATDWLRAESPPSDLKGALLRAGCVCASHQGSQTTEAAAQWQLLVPIILT